MHRLLAGPLILFGFAALIGTTGCARPTPTTLVERYTPPVPKPAAGVEIEQPPLVASSAPNLARSPRALLQEAARQQAERVIAAAQQYFDSGRALMEQGEPENARKEFDFAVEALLAFPRTHPERESIETALARLVDRIHTFDVIDPESRAGSGSPASADQDNSFEDVEAIALAAAQAEATEMTFPVDPHLEDRIVQTIEASASQLPLEINEEVLKFIRYFTQTKSGRKVIVNGFRRMGRYRSMIQRIFDEEGIPRELIHLAEAESGFNPRAVSNKRATGMWQFMKERGQQYGLQQDKYREDRFNPEKASRAAARHLKDLYNRFGDWYLVLAAYNWGPETVDRAVERTGYADFWYLQRTGNVPPETANHIPIIIGMAIIAKNPAVFGFDSIDPLAPLEFEEVEIDALTGLQLVADVAGCTETDLTDLNPALLQKVVPAGYRLRVPKGAGNSVRTALARVPVENRALWRAHKVTDGETLTVIAQRYRAKVDLIATANQLAPDALRSGDLLVIPLSR